MEIFRLFGTVFVDNKKANESLDETDKKGFNLSKTLGVAAKGATLAAGAIATAGTAAAGLAMKAAEAADRINDTAPKIGISTQAFQEYDYVLSQSGTQIESLQGGMKKLVAAMTTENKATLFESLGVSITDTEGKMRSQEAVFEDTVKAMQGMADGAEKARLANDLFGKAGTELMPLLNAEAGSFDELKNKANELGLVMGEDAVAAGAEFADNLDSLKSIMGAVVNKVGVELVPVLNTMATYIIDHMPEIEAATKTAFDIISMVVGNAKIVFSGLKDVVFALYELIKPALPVMSKLSEMHFGKMKDDINGLMSAYQTFIQVVVGAIKAVKEFMDLEGSKGGRLNEDRYIPGYASGTSYHPGGWAIVGEQGPELLNLPRGSEVIPNNQLGGTVNNYFTITGLTWSDIERQIAAKGVRFA